MKNEVRRLADKQYEIRAKVASVQLLMSGGVILKFGQTVIVDKETKEMRRAKKHGLIEYKEYKPKKTETEKPAAKKPEKKPEVPKETPKKEEKSPEELPIEEFNPDKASAAMVRAKAKDLGIKGYSSKKLEDLRKLVKEKLKK